MKKFQFGLDTVLRYQQQVLEGLQNEHAALLLKVRQQEERLKQAEGRYSALNLEFRRAEREGVTIPEAMRYENGLRYLEGEIQRAEQLLRQYEAEAEAKRRQVVAARQSTASLEKLREKKLESYQKDAQKSEEQFIDELVSTTRVMEAGRS